MSHFVKEDDLITIQGAEDGHLQGILDLQRANLPKSLSPEIMMEQGFVTVKHNYELLKSMNDIHPHAIALDKNKVIGYALAMDKSFATKIPFLVSLFNRATAALLKANSDDPLNFIVMGQTCIDKDYRSKGLFSQLHNNLKVRLSNSYDSIFTDVACKNTRSIRAHQKVGYQSVEVFKVEDEYWNVIEWKWNLRN